MPSGSSPWTVDTALTQKVPGGLLFRGHDAVRLSQSHRFESVAHLLWTGNLLPQQPWESDPLAVEMAEALPSTLGLVPRMSMLCAAVGDTEPHPLDRQRSVRVARMLVATIVDGLPRRSQLADDSIAARLWARLSTEVPSPPELRTLDRIMSVLSDEGVVPSTMVARACGSAGASLSVVVQSAAGSWVSTMSASRVEEVYGLLEGSNPGAERGDGVASVDDNEDAHVAFMLALVRQAFPSRSARIDGSVGGRDPMRALACFCWAAGMEPQATPAIAVVARSAGWIAHAMEEHRKPTGLGVRVRYSGPGPVDEASRRMLDSVQNYLRD